MTVSSTRIQRPRFLDSPTTAPSQTRPAADGVAARKPSSFEAVNDRAATPGLLRCVLGQPVCDERDEEERTVLERRTIGQREPHRLAAPASRAAVDEFLVCLEEPVVLLPQVARRPETQLPFLPAKG